MKEIILATHNDGKLKEFNEILNPLNIKCLGLKELDYYDDIIEDGNTFEENALIKARIIYERFNKPVLADDSGLCIKQLNNEPGIYSARYMNLETFKLKMEYILDKMNNVDREAFFNCTLVLKTSEEFVFEGIMEGSISNGILGDNGFGYDPIFIPNGYDKTLAQLSNEVKNKISHRKNAIDKLLEYLNENNIF